MTNTSSGQTKSISLLLRALDGSNEVKISGVVEFANSSNSTGINDDDMYKTGSGKYSHAKALNTLKLKQRRAMVKHARQNGVVLDLFAGRGNLNKSLYHPIARKCILVEKDPKTIPLTKETVDLKKCTIYNMDNHKFITEELPKIKEEFSIVDFDAFGVTIPTINLFFKNYKVTKPLIVGVTDGYGLKVAHYWNNKDLLAEWLTKFQYPIIEKKGMTINIFMIHTITRQFEMLANIYNLKLTKLNCTHNRHGTVYCGYLLKPK